MRPLSDPGATVDIAGIRYQWELLTIDEPGSGWWAHPAVAIAPDDSLLVAAASGRMLVSVRADGTTSRLPIPVTECHGLAADSTGGVWIADNGHKRSVVDGCFADEQRPGAVLHVDAAGSIVQRLEPPPGVRPWQPTGVAVHDYGDASAGRIWVADGYGNGLVHCFSADGTVTWTSDGSASGLPFRTPHGIVIDTRSSTPRLLVADRGNRRIVALTLDGDHLGTVGETSMTSPSGLAIHGDRLWVTELFGGIRVVNQRGSIEGGLGDALEPRPSGWPNALDGSAVIAPVIRDGAFRSPHGIAVTAGGTVVVTEWILGGRVSRLTPLGIDA